MAEVALVRASEDREILDNFAVKMVESIVNLQNLGPIVDTYVWPASYERRYESIWGHVNVAYTY